MLLAELLKNTAKDHPDHAHLKEVMMEKCFLGC
jgi:hypothetical protein